MKNTVCTEEKLSLNASLIKKRRDNLILETRILLAFILITTLVNIIIYCTGNVMYIVLTAMFPYVLAVYGMTSIALVIIALTAVLGSIRLKGYLFPIISSLIFAADTIFILAFFKLEISVILNLFLHLAIIYAYLSVMSSNSKLAKAIKNDAERERKAAEQAAQTPAADKPQNTQAEPVEDEEENVILFIESAVADTADQ